MQIDDMTIEQLVQASQAIGQEIDALKQRRGALKAEIDARLASAAQAAEAGAVAAGAVIDVSAGG